MKKVTWLSEYYLDVKNYRMLMYGEVGVQQILYYSNNHMYYIWKGLK